MKDIPSEAAPGKYRQIFDQLGDSEPETLIEAQAILENKRQSLGHVDEYLLAELEKNKPWAKQLILATFKKSSETEAAAASK